MPKKKQSKFSLDKIPWWIGSILIGLVFFALYFVTMPPNNVGYADSDELITVAYNRGVAHPPGYPVYVGLLHLFLQIPLGFNPAAQAHLFSIILASLTLAIIYSTSYLIHQLIKVKKKDFLLGTQTSEGVFIALLSSVSLGVSFLFWTYGHIAEKVIFSAFITSLILLCYSLYFKKQGKGQLKIWIIIWLLFGFAVGHHQSLILFFIPNLLLLWHQSKKSIKNSILPAITSVILGFTLSVVILWLLNSSSAPVSWGFEPTLDGLISHLTRQDFAGELYSQGKEISAYYSNLDISASLDALWQYILVTIQHFGLWLVLIALLALRYGYRQSKKMFVVILSAYLLLGPFLAAYLKYPEDWGSQAIAQRQFIAGFTVLPILLVFGWTEYVRRLGKSLTVLTNKKIVNATLILLPLLVFSFRLITLYPQLDLSQYDHVHQKFHSMMLEFEPDAVVTCYSDVSCFALLYERYALNTRQDVQIVPLAHPLMSDQLEQQELQRFTYQKNPFMVFDIVTWNIGKRPIYAVEINEFYYKFYGLEIPSMFYLPLGYYGQLTRTMPESFPEYDNSLTQKWLDTPTPEIDNMRKHHKASIGRDHLINGTVRLAAADRIGSLKEFNQASNIYHQFGKEEQIQISNLRTKLERVQPNEDFSPDTSLDSSQKFLNFLPELLEKNLLGKSYSAAKAAVAIEPENIQARLYLAQVFEKAGDVGFAQMEYLHALMIDPDNQDAQAGFLRLSQ